MNSFKALLNQLDICLFFPITICLCDFLTRFFKQMSNFIVCGNNGIYLYQLTESSQPLRGHLLLFFHLVAVFKVTSSFYSIYRMLYIFNKYNFVGFSHNLFASFYLQFFCFSITLHFFPSLIKSVGPHYGQPLFSGFSLLFYQQQPFYIFGENQLFNWLHSSCQLSHFDPQSPVNGFPYCLLPTITILKYRISFC